MGELVPFYGFVNLFVCQPCKQVLLRYGKDDTVLMRLYCDGIPVRKGLKPDSFLAWYWTDLATNERFLICVIRKRDLCKVVRLKMRMGLPIRRPLGRRVGGNLTSQRLSLSLWGKGPGRGDTPPLPLGVFLRFWSPRRV